MTKLTFKELTEEQQLNILKKWEEGGEENPPSIEQLLEVAFPEKKLDGRTKEGKIIKAFLVERGLQVKTKTTYEKKGLLELTNEQEEYIRNNSNMNSDEIAKILWNNNTLTTTSQEARTVYAFQRKLIKDGVINAVKTSDGDELSMKDYVPPKSIDKVCYKINKYIKGENLDPKNLKPTQKKQINSIISYLNVYRFIYQMNSYTKEKDRELFESTYLSYVYDKPDLTREDLDKTVILSTEAVISASKLKTIDMLENEQKNSIDTSGRLSMAIVDAIKTTTEDYNNSVKRQQALYNDLTKKRSDRLNDRLGGKASVLNLVEMWKNEETRMKMLRLADKRKEKVSEEIDRLEKMEDVIAMVAGIDKNEILNG